MTAPRRVLPFALALVALALAAVSAYAAHTASGIERDFRRSDAAFSVEPGRKGLWTLPGGSLGLHEILGIEDDVKFRRASRLFELLRRHGSDLYDPRSRALLADAHLALARAQETGLSREGRSRAANLEGVLVFDDARGQPADVSTLITRSLEYFRRAVRTDPTNEEAPYNLELLLRLREPTNSRRAVLEGRSNLGRGVAGAAPIRRGHGY